MYGVRYIALWFCCLACVVVAQDSRPVMLVPGKGQVVPVMREAMQQQDMAGTRSGEVPSPTPLDPQDPALAENDVKVPVGGIVAWATGLAHLPELPSGWVPCNGQILEDPASPLNGQPIPDLNAAMARPGRFLRGAVTGGDIGGSEIHNHGAYRSQKTGEQRSPVSSALAANHVPPYYTVTWIMRVK